MPSKMDFYCPRCNGRGLTTGCLNCRHGGQLLEFVHVVEPPTHIPKINGVPYTTERVVDTQRALIQMRNSALERNAPYLATVLSHAIMLLSGYLTEEKAVDDRYRD